MVSRQETPPSEQYVADQLAEQHAEQHADEHAAQRVNDRSARTTASAPVTLAPATRLQLLVGFAVLYVLWGSTYLGIAVALRTIPPFLLGAARFLTAGSILFSWCLFRGAKLPTLLEWRNALIIGAMLLFVGNGSVSWAEQRVSSGMTSLLVATVPLWLVLCQWWQGIKPTGIQLIGVAIGMLGVGLLVLPAGTGADGGAGRGGAAIDPFGVLLLSCSALSWTIGSLYSRSAVLAKPASMAIAMQMLAGGTLLGLLSLASGEAGRFLSAPPVSAESAGALLYLIVFGSLIGFSTYMWLLRVASPTAVGTYAYVNPVVAVLLGVVILGEAFPPRALLATLVILGGVVLVTVAPHWHGYRRRG